MEVGKILIGLIDGAQKWRIRSKGRNNERQRAGGSFFGRLVADKEKHFIWPNKIKCSFGVQ